VYSWERRYRPVSVVLAGLQEGRKEFSVLFATCCTSGGAGGGYVARTSCRACVRLCCAVYVLPPPPPPPRAPLVPKPSSLLAPPLRPICLRHIPRAPELLMGYRDDQSDIATSSRFADRLSVIVLELCERYWHGSVVVCENCFWQLVSFGSLP